MRAVLVASFLIVAADPALAVTEQPRVPAERPPSIDRLYPELSIEGEGWRGLLPIMLMNVEQTVRRQSAGADSGDRRTR